MDQDFIFEQASNIVKAHGYDILCKQVTQLKEQNKELKDTIGQFIHAVEHEGVVNGRVVDAVKMVEQ